MLKLLHLVFEPKTGVCVGWCERSKITQTPGQRQDSNTQMKSEELHQVGRSRVDWCVYFSGIKL